MGTWICAGYCRETDELVDEYVLVGRNDRWADVFRRPDDNSSVDRWEVTSKEVPAIEAAIGHCLDHERFVYFISKWKAAEA